MCWSARAINNELRPVRKKYIETIFEELTDDKRRHGYFQQDNVTARTTCNSVSELQELFYDRNISSGLWPSRSSDFSAYDFDLWENIRRNVNKNISRTAEVPKKRDKGYNFPDFGRRNSVCYSGIHSMVWNFFKGKLWSLWTFPLNSGNIFLTSLSSFFCIWKGFMPQHKCG